MEWHQDWAFYPHTNDDILAVGVMLDDTTVENGAMYVLLGTHKGPTFDRHGIQRRIVFFEGTLKRRLELRVVEPVTA